MADINPGDLLILKNGSSIGDDVVGWVIQQGFIYEWWTVEWTDGDVSTESSENIRKYKKAAHNKMQKLIKK